jgi:DNA-binding Lrp family transcriptional regulator
MIEYQSYPLILGKSKKFKPKYNKLLIMKKNIENKETQLDKYDKMILFELDKNCRVPLTKLAKKVRRSRQSVEYRINNMTDAGIITGFRASINPAKLGYRLFKIYIQTKNIESERAKMLKFLRESGNVYWMGEIDGEWDMIMAVSAKTEKEFFEFKSRLFSKFGPIIIRYAGDILFYVHQYPKMYFTENIEKPTMFAGEVVYNRIDVIDSKILSELIRDARLHVNEIARRAGTTPAIVRSKMKRMEKLGIIIQYRIDIDLGKLGLQLFKAIVHFDKYTEEEEKRFIVLVSSLTNTHYIVQNMWQTELELVVSNYVEYIELINKLKKNFPSFIRNVEALLMKTDEWTPGYKNIIS